MSISFRKHSSPGWKSGEHWVECDVCGDVFRNSVMIRRWWDNLIVDPGCYDPKHPQEYVRARNEDVTAKGLINPRTSPNYVVTACVTEEYNMDNFNAVAGYGIAGCAIAGYELPPAGTFDGSL